MKNKIMNKWTYKWETCLNKEMSLMIILGSRLKWVTDRHQKIDQTKKIKKEIIFSSNVPNLFLYDFMALIFYSQSFLIIIIYLSTINNIKNKITSIKLILNKNLYIYLIAFYSTFLYFCTYIFSTPT